ncbi:MAG: hypothetical protein EA404_01580 [Spirochaetaceae bacterium]|nr:MAG: hypothetical protein EA404_01580 [Spirochaetaceae bacterium]
MSDREEHQQRIALLRKLKDTLQAQRDKLARYLVLLESQEATIRTSDVDGIVRQAELETQLLREIEAVQKVLWPLEKLYVEFYPDGESQIPPLRQAVEELRQSVMRHNQHNRDLLRAQVDRVRLELESMRPPSGPRSLYADIQPSMLDIST